MPPTQTGDFTPCQQLILEICFACACCQIIQTLSSCWCNPPAQSEKHQVGNQDKDRGYRGKYLKWSFFKLSIDLDRKKSRDCPEERKDLDNGNNDDQRPSTSSTHELLVGKSFKHCL